MQDFRKVTFKLRNLFSPPPLYMVVWPGLVETNKTVSEKANLKEQTGKLHLPSAYDQLQVTISDKVKIHKLNLALLFYLPAQVPHKLTN